MFCKIKPHLCFYKGEVLLYIIQAVSLVSLGIKYPPETGGYLIAGSSNGRTHPSGGWYLGSNPGPAAIVDFESR